MSINLLKNTEYVRRFGSYYLLFMPKYRHTLTHTHTHTLTHTLTHTHSHKETLLRLKTLYVVSDLTKIIINHKLE